MQPTLTAPGSKRLKAECEKLLSNLSFKSNLRRYTEGCARAVVLDGWTGFDDRSLIAGDGPQFIADIRAVDDLQMFRSDAEDHCVVDEDEDEGGDWEEVDEARRRVENNNTSRYQIMTYVPGECLICSYPRAADEDEIHSLSSTCSQ